MRQILLRVSMMVAAVLAARPAAAKIVFSDGFESGTGLWALSTTAGANTWGTYSSGRTTAHSGTYCLTDTPAGNYSASTSYIAQIASPFNFVGATAPKLTFWYRHETEYHEHAVWQASTDGTTWTTVKQYEDNYSSLTAWAQDTVDFTAYAGYATVYLRFMLPVDSNSYLDDGWYIDDVQVDDGIMNIAVTSPAPGVSLAGGTASAVTWTYDGTLTGAASFRVDYSTDGGTTFPSSVATGLALTTRTTSWTLPAGLTSSSVVVRVQALSSSGTVLGAAQSGIFSIDSTPPTAPSLSAPTNGACAVATPTFAWTHSPSETVTYTLKVTPTTGTALVKTGLTTKSQALTAGEALTPAGSPYTWSVAAVDAAGNTTTSSTWSFFVDSVSPGSFSLLTPAALAWARSGSSFTWSSANDTGCGTVTYVIYLDGVACNTAGTTATSATLSGCTATDGTHSWAVLAKDGSGNQVWCSDGSAGRQVQIDNTAPTGTTLASPAAGATVTDTTPTFTWTASTDAGSGGLKYQLLIDGSAVGTAGTALTADALSTLTEGYHYWGVRVTDAVGNTFNTSTQTFYVDTLAPATFTLYTPADNGCMTSPTPSLCWNSASDTAGIASYQLFIDGAANATTASGSSTCQTPNAALTQGTHTWTVKATDRGGHTTASSQTRTVIIDWTEPGSFTLLSPADGATVASPTPVLAWNAATDIGGLARYEVYIDGSYKAQTNGATRTWSPSSALAATTHTWYVRAYDNCGQYSDSPQWSFSSTTSCSPGATETCAGPSVGICQPGSRICSTGGSWGTCVGQILPASEICNNLDDDCDGQTDEGLTSCAACTGTAPRSCYTGPTGTSGVGTCASGTQTCSGGVWGACTGQVLPATETCDSKDNDCDGQTDEGLTGCGCTPEAEVCDNKDNDCDGQTDEGLASCCTKTNGGTEICDGKDNDCDLKVDEGADDQPLSDACYTAAAGYGVGPCKAGKRTCSAGAYGECVGQVTPTPEVCDGVDNDCDGKTDDGLTSCDAGAPDSGAEDRDAGVDRRSPTGDDGGDGCGCQASGGSQPLLVSLLGLALIGLRRRRR